MIHINVRVVDQRPGVNRLVFNVNTQLHDSYLTATMLEGLGKVVEAYGDSFESIPDEPTHGVLTDTLPE